jgi:type IV secretory pathway TrbF-like protein
MRFSRPSVRYSKALPPETPYQAAQQLWDERMGAARVQAAHWRAMAFGCLALALTVIGGLLWQSVRSHIVPYIVEVDGQGEVKALGPVSDRYAISDGQIAHGLERFIRDVRSLPLDPIVLRDDWLEAYDFVTARGALALNEYARVNDPFKLVGQSSVAVEVSSVVRASKDSFQIRWIERKYLNGALAATEHWTAIVTIESRPPRDEAHLRKNPLGLYVDALNWGRELGTTAN